MEAAATPFPREETTPPVTKMYFGPVGKALESLQRVGVQRIMSGKRVRVKLRFGRAENVEKQSYFAGG
jgi:hypothetical protein